MRRDQLGEFDLGKSSSRITAFAVILSSVLAFSAARAEAPAGGAQTLYTVPHVSAQLLVRRAPGTPTTVIENLLSALGGTVVLTSATSGIDVVTINNDGDLEAAIALLDADPGIEYAEPNYLTKLWATPNDLQFSQQWSKENTGVNAPNGLGNPGADLNLVAAWDTQSTATGVTIAVIDDSMETAHVDLAANVLPTGRCFASPSSARPCTNGPNDPNPADGNDFHGTLVAGTAAAHGNNGIGVAGTAWETSLLPLKVDLSYFAIVEAIDEAIAQNATIINMSFGGPVESQSLSRAIDRAEAAGILMIASAGNADANNGFASHYPSDSTQDNVLSIASSDSRDRISGFSQWGMNTVHLAAPGDLVRTTANGNGFATVSGTSFSAPHTAGVAALVFANAGTSDYRQVKAQLLNGTVNGRNALGPVTPGQDKEAVPGRVMTGRLDANAALTAATGGVLLVTGIAVNDTATGNANGKLDPGESAQLLVTLRNVWNDETGVTATLSTVDSSELFINDITPVVVGDIARDAERTATFSVTLSNSVTGNRQLFLRLDLASAASGTIPSRYFYHEVGTLRNGQTISQAAQRYDWDEFQAFNVDVPAGASDLDIATSGLGDVDLLVRFNVSPEYLITLNAPAGSGFYYVDSETRVSATAGANESVSIPSPLPGTYHVVVVNYDQQPKTYDISASYSLPTAGEISFSSATYSASEGDGTATITVTRSGAVGGATVDYATDDLTAATGADYVATTGTLSWGFGENGSKTFTVPLVDDDDSEPDETLRLTLSNVDGAALGANPTAILTIADNESEAGSIAFAQPNYAVTESTGRITVTVSRSGGSQGQATVDYATQAGQATAGSDFDAASGTLTWADGESGARTIEVMIVNDATQESQESFSLALSNTQGAAMGSPSSTTIDISDDDATVAGNSSGGGGSADRWILLMLATFLLVRAGRDGSNGPSRRACRRKSLPAGIPPLPPPPSRQLPQLRLSPAWTGNRPWRVRTARPARAVSGRPSPR